MARLRRARLKRADIGVAMGRQGTEAAKGGKEKVRWLMTPCHTA